MRDGLQKDSSNEREQLINTVLKIVAGILKENNLAIEIMDNNSVHALCVSDKTTGKKYAILEGINEEIHL